LTTTIDAQLVDWLLAGAPMIRWRVMRALLQEPESVWRAEQARVVAEGWGAAFLR